MTKSLGEENDNIVVSCFGFFVANLSYYEMAKQPKIKITNLIQKLKTDFAKTTDSKNLQI